MTNELPISNLSFINNKNPFYKAVSLQVNKSENSFIIPPRSGLRGFLRPLSYPWNWEVLKYESNP